MKRLLTSLSLILFISGIGQDVEFSQMSAKAKSKLAKKEAREAKADPVYKELMAEGHSYFSNKNYELALDRYEKARLKRPYNVYPKVKIVDVELAMGNADENQNELEKPEDNSVQIRPEEIIQSPEENPETTQQERVDKMMEEELKKSESMVKEEIPDEPPVEKEKPKTVVIAKPVEEIKVLSKKEFQEELGKTYPNGMTEETFKEGNKVVTRRIVVKEGIGDEYRKVSHPWGGVFYFKNGDSISQRMWDLESNP